jgi:uncharacterized membrane protein YkvA (DUF1232 family)
MTNETNKSLTSNERDEGFFRSLRSQLKLVLRLIADRRVNLLLKFLPLATIIYLIFPDFIPGPVDDTVILGLGLYTFVEMCPDEVVEEHRAAIKKANAQSSESNQKEGASG